MHKVACLFSGGKDSVFAVFWAMHNGWEPILLTMLPAPYSMMFHHPNAKWANLQAESMELPHLFVEPGKAKEKGKMEKEGLGHEGAGEKTGECEREQEARETMEELDALKEALAGLEIKGIVTGAIASEYQKQRIDKIGHELGVPTYSPLWHKDKVLLEEMEKYFEIYITAVSAEGLGPELLGKKFGEIGKRKNIHPLLEGGEGETFVTDAPFFKKRIEIKKWKTEWDGVRGVAHIEEAKLVNK